MSAAAGQYVGNDRKESLHFARLSRVCAKVEQTILQRVADGQAEAVQECLDHYGGLVWSLARRFCFNRAEVEDAVQEIFIDVWKSAKRFDPGVASETTFIAMIARRRLIDRQRKHGRKPDMDDVREEMKADGRLGDGDPVADGSLGEDAQRAMEAMKELRPEQQRVLRLAIFYGLSHEKIAEATDMPLGTVKTHARRGLIKLRDIVAQRDEAGTDARAAGEVGS